MATTKFYLDCRVGSSPYPIKLTITHDRKSVQLSMGIKIAPEEWDGCKVIKHPRAKMLNTQLAARKSDIDCQILEWQRDGKLKGKSAKDIKAMLDDSGDSSTVSWGDYFLICASRRKGTTANMYKYTYERLMAWRDIHSISMGEITATTLREFEEFMSRTMPSPNSRAVHFDNIRAVCNDAIDDEITQNYPFRKFKYRRVETKKRSLSLDELKTLLSCELEEHQIKYRDIFLLTILLRGINIIDLYHLTPENIVGDRIEYIRAKTKKLISVKVEKEAMELINKYKGVKHLVDIADSYQNHKDFISRIDKNLKRIGTVTIGKHGKKTITPLFPKLSTYWARHTFASIAYNDCSIAIDTISDMLGHSNGMRVTNIYIRRNEKIADEAARKVIDKILYDK